MESCEVRQRSWRKGRAVQTCWKSWVLCQIGVVVKSSRSHDDEVVNRRIAGERDGLLMIVRLG